MRESIIYQDILAEGAIIGEARGRTQGERKLIIKQLTRKLGSIDPTIQAQVNSLQIDRVESLGEALLDFTLMTDLENWLAANT